MGIRCARGVIYAVSAILVLVELLLAHSAVAQSRPNDLPALLVTPSEIVLPAGDTSALSVVDKAGRPVADVQWSINPQIANLQQENGEVLVQGREAGRATLTAIANHQSATAVITW
jgi:methionine-rich copper-binding protein CopC